MQLQRLEDLEYRGFQKHLSVGSIFQIKGAHTSARTEGPRDASSKQQTLVTRLCCLKARCQGDLVTDTHNHNAQAQAMEAEG